MSLLDKILNLGIAGTCVSETHHNVEYQGIQYCTLVDERYKCNCRDDKQDFVVLGNDCGEYFYRCNNSKIRK